MLKTVFSKLLEFSKKQRGAIIIPVLLIAGFTAVTVVILVPAIQIATMDDANWTTNGAILFLERSGYTMEIPATDLDTDDLLPNTDSTWDVGASTNEFIALETDKYWQSASEVSVTGLQDVFYNVLAITADNIVNNEDLSAGVPITFTIIAQPDVPRTLSMDFDSHLQITAYTIVITGVDSQGNVIVETFTEAVDPWNFETDAAFATVTTVIMTARTGTGAADTGDVGITDVLGLSNLITATGDVWKITKNAVDQTIAGAQVNIITGTYDMAVIGLLVTDDFTIWYDGNISTID